MQAQYGHPPSIPFRPRRFPVSDDRNLYSYDPGADGVEVLSHPDEQYTTGEMTSKYQRIILRTEGDWTFHNKSEAAIALVDVMRRS
jgi:hypothetical protein